MVERKYEKNILTELKLPADIQAQLAEYSKTRRRILWMEDEIVPESFSVICSWYFKAMTEEEAVPSHVHDYDEVIGFFGGNPEDPYELGGEVEFWMEDEKYLLNKSCLIYIPAGVRHCPLRVTEVDKPLFFLAVSLTSKYVKKGIIHQSSSDN
jgi:quercetin dioxygenase-like cupin family protein